MLLFFLALGGAIATFHVAQRVQDESIAIIGLILSLIFLCISLVTCQWGLQSLIVFYLLCLPNCRPHRFSSSVACPRLCLRKRRCSGHAQQPSHVQQLRHPTTPHSSSMISD